MNIDKIVCLLGITKKYENSDVMRRGKSRTINYY